jgi:hypothetical protein
MNSVDTIIIGSGIAGLYCAYNIKKYSPDTNFLILEKYKKQWIGGRTNNEIFYDTQIVTGAGIGRKSKDKLLFKLLIELELPTRDFLVNPQYSKLINQIDINKVMNKLRDEYVNSKNKSNSFKNFAKTIMGEKLYNEFLISVGYTDYENEDVEETLYHYGMEDNTCCWKAFSVPWKEMVLKLAKIIGEKQFKFSNNVIKISKVSENPNKFMIETEIGKKYLCNKLIIATTITGIRQLLPNYQIYDNIEGQPFLRIYGKFSKKSISIMKEYVNGYTILPTSLQKIIPINPDKGIYMIAYNDNNNTIALKNYLENTEVNRIFYCELLEKSLGIQTGLLELIAIKSYYWSIGTHYYKPLDKNKYISREKFIYKSQRPEKGIIVVGEVVSRNQGWVEGALKSVKTILPLLIN